MQHVFGIALVNSNPASVVHIIINLKVDIKMSHCNEQLHFRSLNRFCNLFFADDVYVKTSVCWLFCCKKYKWPPWNSACFEHMLVLLTVTTHAEGTRKDPLALITTWPNKGTPELWGLLSPLPSCRLCLQFYYWQTRPHTAAIQVAPARFQLSSKTSTHCIMITIFQSGFLHLSQCVYGFYNLPRYLWFSSTLWISCVVEVGYCPTPL